jgi:hypothetical protein
MQKKQAGKVAVGVLLMLAAGAALFVIYSMRPPEGIGDAVRIISKGQDYIKEPYYQVLMGLAGVTALIGTILFIVGLTGRK